MLTEQQKINRQKGIGGSDVAAICGMSPWKTAYDVWLEKTGQMQEDLSNNNAVIRGTHSEDIIRNWYEANYNPVETTEETFKHPEHDFLIAHVDGLNREKDLILECKTARSTTGWGMEGTAEIPDTYLFQVAHYAMILGLNQVDIAVLFKLSDKFALYHYKRHKDLEEAILAACSQFWNYHVLKGVPPEIKTLDSAKRAFERAQDVEAYASDDVCGKVETLRDVQQKQKELKKQEEDLKTQIMLEMRDANRLVDSQKRTLATWKNVTSSRFDSTQLKKDNPGLASKYMKEKQSRRFVLKGAE